MGEISPGGSDEMKTCFWARELYTFSYISIWTGNAMGRYTTATSTSFRLVKRRTGVKCVTCHLVASYPGLSSCRMVRWPSNRAIVRRIRSRITSDDYSSTRLWEKEKCVRNGLISTQMKRRSFVSDVRPFPLDVSACVRCYPGDLQYPSCIPA